MLRPRAVVKVPRADSDFVHADRLTSSWPLPLRAAIHRQMNGPVLNIRRDHECMQPRERRLMRPQILSSAKPATFDVEERQLPCRRWPQVDVQTARIVALADPVRRHERRKVARVLSHGRDDYDGEGIQLLSQLY